MGFKALASKFAGKTIDLMTEDTIQMKDSKAEMGILLLDSSDQNFLDYTSAFARLYEKRKLTRKKFEDFMIAFFEYYERRPLAIQQKAISILEGVGILEQKQDK